MQNCRGLDSYNNNDFHPTGKKCSGDGTSRFKDTFKFQFFLIQKDMRQLSEYLLHISGSPLNTKFPAFRGFMYPG